ncbi:hypothetical protein [Sinorhizobium meliloti]
MRKALPTTMKYFLIVTAVCLAGQVSAQENYWSEVDRLSGGKAIPKPDQKVTGEMPADLKKSIKERCTAKWLRGDDMDYRMIEHCIKGDVEAFERIREFN